MNLDNNINIFQPKQDIINKNKVIELFGFKNNDKKEQINHEDHKFTSKRLNFKNQIRRTQMEQMRKCMRQQLIKTFQSSQFIILLQNLSEKQQLNLKNVNNLLTDLKRNMNDRNFCDEIQKNSKIKQFIINLFGKNTFRLSVTQKSMLLQSLIFLTYYGTRSLNEQQKIYLNDLLKQEVSQISDLRQQNVEYFLKIVDLLMNLVASYNQSHNYQLIDNGTSQIIHHKLLQLEMQLNKLSNHSQQYQKILQSFSNIKSSFLSLLFNATTTKNVNRNFFQFIINNIVITEYYFNDLDSARQILRILNNFFKNNQFLNDLFENPDFCGWYERTVPTIAQKRYNDMNCIQTGEFTDPNLTDQEIDLFAVFLNNFICWIENQNFEQIAEQTKQIIQNNLNAYFLSQFLIECASKQRKNSQYVKRAIKVFEYLSQDQQVSRQQLLIVRKGRYQEDILKVFLNPTYFISIKTSEIVLSFLNKLLSKDYHLLEKLMELGIFECINDFFQMNNQPKPEQIIRILELLMIMIASEDDLLKDTKNSDNRIVRLIQQNRLLQKIQKFQDKDQQQVVEKAQMFMKFFQAKSDCNSRGDISTIQI